MIIICPACDTKFMLSASAMGEQGREVRCARCSHQWHAKPGQEHAPAPQKDVTFPQEAKMSAEEHPEIPQNPFPEEDAEVVITQSLAQYDRKKVVPPGQQPLWKVTAALLLLGCALMLTLVMRETLAPSLKSVYASLGYYPEDGIALADISLKQLPTRPTEPPRYDILCTIFNQSKETRRIPPLSMKILNKEGVVLAEDESILQNSGEKLAAGKTVACKGLRFANPFDTAAHLVIDMGSPMDLSLRSEWATPEEGEEGSEDSEEDEHG